jgi:hypothetical protein
MPYYLICTRDIQGASFSSDPRSTRLRPVLKLSNVKRIGVAPRAGRVGLPESAPAKAVGVDCGARFLKAHPTTNPVFLKDLTLADEMDRNVIPTRVSTPTLSLAEK